MHLFRPWFLFSRCCHIWKYFSSMDNLVRGDLFSSLLGAGLSPLYQQKQSEAKFWCLRDQSGTNFPVCSDPIYCQTLRFRLRCDWRWSALGMVLFAPVFPLKSERQGQERIAAPLLKFTLGELSWHSCTAIHAEHALTQMYRQRCSSWSWLSCCNQTLLVLKKLYVFPSGILSFQLLSLSLCNITEGAWLGMSLSQNPSIWPCWDKSVF